MQNNTTKPLVAIKKSLHTKHPSNKILLSNFFTKAPVPNSFRDWVMKFSNKKYQLNLESRKVLINDTLFQVDGYSPHFKFVLKAHKKKCVKKFNEAKR